MSDKPQDSAMSSPPAASPSTEPQNRQDAMISQEDIDMFITVANDLYCQLVDLLGMLKVEECMDDSSEPPLPSLSRISDCTAVIKKVKVIMAQSIVRAKKNKSESAAKSESFTSEMLQLAKFLKEVIPGYEAPEGSEGLLSILKTAHILLKTSSCKKISQPEADDHARRKEQENLSEELRNIEQRLRNGTLGIVATKGSKSPLIISSIHQHITEMQNKKSSLSADLLLLEEEKKKIDEAHNSTKRELKKAMRSTRTAEQGLEKCKAELEQAKLEASSAKATEALLASNMGRLLDRTQGVLSHIEFPGEVLSMEIPDKVGWLAGEHERTCMELIATKQNLAHANSELDKHSADLKTAKLKAERLVAVEDVLSLIEFPMEIHPEQTLDRVKWLACDYMRTCEEHGEMKLILEQAKGELDKRSADLKAAELEVEKLVSNMKKANKEGLDTETTHMNLGENLRWLARNYKRDSEEFGAMKSKLEQAKCELDKCSTDLEATRLEANKLRAIENAISQIPVECNGQSLDKLMWLACDYRKTCEELNALKWNSEREKRELLEHYAEFMVQREFLSRESVNELFETSRVLEREANEADSGTGTWRRERTVQAADFAHSGHPMYNSPIAPHSGHHGSVSTYPQPHMQQRVNSMSYDSHSQQFGAGDYDASERWMHMENLRNVQADGGQRMPHLQPDNRPEFYRGRPDEQGPGSRPHGRATGR